MVDTTRLGGSIGKRVAGLVGDATVATRAKAAIITQNTFLSTQDAFFRLMGAEIRDTLGPVFREVADHPDTPEWARRTFSFLGREHGQWQAFLAQNLGGQALSVGLGSLLNNYMTRAIGGIIAKSPQSWLPLDGVIGALARNIPTGRNVRGDAHAQGIRSVDLDLLVELAQHEIAAGDIIDGLNRGTITEGGARVRLRNDGFSDRAVDDLIRMRAMRITPQEASALENFGVITRAQGQAIANSHGMSDTDYDRLALGGGQAPGLSELLDAFRRGIINEARLQKGIDQSPIRREWSDVIKALRFVSPGVSAPLAAANQNLLPEAEAKRLVAEAGIDPKHFPWLLESEGNPLTPEEAATLFNRGKLSRAQVRQMFLESRLKNKYVDLLFPLFERLPPMELTVRMVREGAMTRAEAITNLRQLGFAERYATALVDLGMREKTTATRDLSVTTIRELYEGQVIGRAMALEALEVGGYEREEAEWLLTIGDLRRERRQLDGAVSRVRSRYVAGRIDQRDAENALDALQVPSGARDDLLDTWEVERDVSEPALTTAQIQGAMKRGLMSADEAYDEFRGRGYDQRNAEILVALASPAPRAPRA